MALDLLIQMIDIEGIEDRYQAWLHQSIKEEIKDRIDDYFDHIPLHVLKKVGNTRIENIDIACPKGMPLQKRVHIIAERIANEIRAAYAYDTLHNKGV